MKALIFRGPRQARVEEIERFQPAEGEVVVRVHAAAVCTTERRIYSGELKLPFPVIGGHEVSGVVEWTPAGEKRLACGDHVIIDTMKRCGACHYCLTGHSNLCLNIRAFRDPYLIIGGGFAEYVVLPAESAFKISPDLSFEEASLAEPVACCWHSVNQAQLSIGDTVAILGAGTMGAIHLLLCKLFSARTIVCDLDAHRLRLAASLGADLLVDSSHQDCSAVVRDFTEGRGADVVFVAAGSKKAGETALQIAAPRARIVLYASIHPSSSLELDWNQIHYREIMLTGSEGKTPKDLYQAARLLSHRAIDVRPLISRLIQLEDLPIELENTPAGETLRVVVRIN
jgi:2-desacetyl-2-hydroxyethyl bacteriochlorophyllide A dehydrogenase